MNLIALFAFANFISLLIFTTFVLGGIYVLYFAIRGKLVLDHARCCTCDYRLGPSHTDGDACPECGTFLDTPTSIRFDRKIRPIGPFALAVTLLFLGISAPLGIVILTDIYGQQPGQIAATSNATPTYMLPVEKTPNKTFHGTWELQDLSFEEVLDAAKIRPSDKGIWENIYRQIQAEQFSTNDLQRSLNIISQSLEEARSLGPNDAIYKKIRSVAVTGFETGVDWLDPANPKHIATLESLANSIIRPASPIFTLPDTEVDTVPLSLSLLLADTTITKSECSFDGKPIDTSLWVKMNEVRNVTFAPIPPTGKGSNHLIRTTVDVSIEPQKTGKNSAQEWSLQLSTEIPIQVAGPGEILTTYIEPDEIPGSYLDAFMEMNASAWANPESKDETILTLTLPLPKDEATVGMFRFEATIDIPNARLLPGGDRNFAFDFGGGWFNLLSVNTKTFIIPGSFDRSSMNVILEPLMIETETTGIFGKRILITNLPIHWLDKAATQKASSNTSPTVTSELIGEDTSRKLFGPSPTTPIDDNDLEEALAIWLDPQIHLHTEAGKPSVVLSYGSSGPPPAPGQLLVSAEIGGKAIPPLKIDLISTDGNQGKSDHRKHITLYVPSQETEIEQNINLEFLGLASIIRRDESEIPTVFGGRIQMEVPVKIDAKEITP